MNSSLIGFSRLSPILYIAIVTIVCAALIACGGSDNNDSDDPDATISVTGGSIGEGDSGTVNIAFTVTLSQALTEAATVDYATSDGTATIADSDYTAANGTVTFSPNVTEQTVSVSVQGDTLEESDETFTLALSNPVGASLANTSATGTIINDDSAVTIPEISISDASVSEGNSGTTAADFSVSLSSATTQTVTVDYASADNTATTANSDYASVSGTLTFAAGETAKTITVNANGDTDVESDETFSVVLTSPVNATLADATGVGTITNDDSPPAPTFGLDARPSNTTCLAVDRPQSDATIQLDRVFANLSFSQPLHMMQAPGDDTRWFVVQRTGRIYVFANDTNVTTRNTFIDVSSIIDSGASEAGLLGMAFDPDFATNGYVYLSYTVPGLTSRIGRFTSLDNGLTLDISTEEVIIDISQPRGNHNGGNIAFGPGPSTGKYLYIGLGDGGGGGDPHLNGQDTETLLGAMLRIDVDVNQTDWNAGTRYYIPSDNPFAANNSCGDGGCPEIFAWGLRNPWRWSFDRDTNALWVADVGQNAWEEIDYWPITSTTPANFGWRCYEGSAVYNLNPDCQAPSNYVDPVFDCGCGAPD